MEVDERIELLKENILRNTKDLLSFDVVEIRLLEQKTGSLVPLLAAGMTDDAVDRALFASPQNNGVTGFVAATGKSLPLRRHDRGPAVPRRFRWGA